MKNIMLWMSGLMLSVLTSCSSDAGYHYEEGLAWNTLYHITYRSDKDLSDSITNVFDEIDTSLSPFNRESSVSRINDNRSNVADRHFAAVYGESRRINRETAGAFDPTLAPLIRAWGFGQGHEVSADTLRVDSLLGFVGINRTELKGTFLSKEDPRVEFNFSALAKGYGVDCIAEMLESNGVVDYLVEVGGEIRAAGRNPKGKEWSVGIDSPESETPDGTIVTAILIDNKAVATSGNYRNYQDVEGGRVGHTLSPVTGRPVDTDVVSATVIAPTCMEADALATSCMVVGSEKALDLCSRLGAGVMLVKRDLSVVSNSIWRASEPGTADPD